MDVVKNEISDSWGDSGRFRARQGTTSLHLPLTLAVTQTKVLVMAGTCKVRHSFGHGGAEPNCLIFEALLRAEKVSWMGIDYPFAYLPRLLGDFEHVPETKRFGTVMLLRR